MSGRGAAPGLTPAERIRATVDAIPAGRVATYGQVAEEAGLPRRARLVGRVLGELASESGLPWHRVVNASGRISARGRGEREQRVRLAREGVHLDARGRVDLAARRWRPEADERGQPSRGDQGSSGRSNSSAGR